MSWKREGRAGGAKSSRQIGLTRLYYPRGTYEEEEGQIIQPPEEERRDDGEEEDDVFEFMARCLGSEGIEGGKKKGRRPTEEEELERRRRRG